MAKAGVTFDAPPRRRSTVSCALLSAPPLASQVWDVPRIAKTTGSDLRWKGAVRVCRTGAHRGVKRDEPLCDTPPSNFPLHSARVHQSGEPK